MSEELKTKIYDKCNDSDNSKSEVVKKAEKYFGVKSIKTTLAGALSIFLSRHSRKPIKEDETKYVVEKGN